MGVYHSIFYDILHKLQEDAEFVKNYRDETNLANNGHPEPRGSIVCSRTKKLSIHWNTSQEHGK